MRIQSNLPPPPSLFRQGRTFAHEAHDTVDRVVYRSVHDRKAAGRVNSCRLRAWVRTITRSVLFHWTTWLTGFVTWAIAGARVAAASTATAVAARNMSLISDLTRVDA